MKASLSGLKRGSTVARTSKGGEASKGYVAILETGLLGCARLGRVGLED